MDKIVLILIAMLCWLFTISWVIKKLNGGGKKLQVKSNIEADSEWAKNQ